MADGTTPMDDGTTPIADGTTPTADGTTPTADDKKPRHKLSADELIEEAHTSIRKVIELLESNGLATESVEHLTSLDNKLDFMVS